MEEFIKTLAIAVISHVTEAVNFVQLGEEQAKHRARAGGGEWNAMLIRRGFETIQHLFYPCGQLVVEPRFLDGFQHRQTGGHRQWVARKSPRLIHRAERRQVFHDFALTTKGTNGQTATDDFTQTGHVRSDAIILLCTAQ